MDKATVDTAAVDEVLDALEGMVFQYLIDYGEGRYGHAFMSAGEEAAGVLVAARPDRWEYADDGKGAYGLHFIGEDL